MCDVGRIYEVNELNVAKRWMFSLCRACILTSILEFGTGRERLLQSNKADPECN